MKKPSWLKHKKHYLTMAIIACVVAFFFMLIHLEHKHQCPPQLQSKSLQPTICDTHPKSAQQTIDRQMRSALLPPAKDKTIIYKIGKGDSLSKILQKQNLSGNEIYNISKLPGMKLLIKQLRPNKTIIIYQAEGRFDGLTFVLSKNRLLNLRRKTSGSGYKTRITKIPLKSKPAFSAGEINSSLSEAIAKTGAKSSVTKQFESIFSWKIDFKRNLHPKDSFAILYQKQYAAGLPTKNGPINLAELITKNKIYFAMRFNHNNYHNGYFNPKGKSWESQFSRHPVHHAYVSSKFSLRRWQPILKIWRPHYGVDFAAAEGTPVHATADGTIKRIEEEKGYGNIIYLKHNFIYSTRYAHLQKFAKGLKLNSRVEKGQVIGYVGQTGLATGPNLHYEVRKYGVPRNPLTLKLPAANPVPKKLRAVFAQQLKKEVTLLQQYLNSAKQKTSPQNQKIYSRLEQAAKDLQASLQKRTNKG